MKKVIFLDRDGVLCEEKSYIKTIAEMKIFPYANEAVGILKSMGYDVYVITNQSAVARGFLDESTLLKIHENLKNKTKVDKIFHCPHLPPEEGEKQEPPYKIDCDCRKPKVGLIKKAIDMETIDKNRSYFVGDRATDILTGEAIGVITVLLESGYGTRRLEQEVTANLRFENLLEFAKYIEKGKQ